MIDVLFEIHKLQAHTNFDIYISRYLEVSELTDDSIERIQNLIKTLTMIIHIDDRY